jgi:hypothetical protein
MDVTGFAVELGSAVDGLVADQVAAMDELLAAHLTPYLIFNSDKSNFI